MPVTRIVYVSGSIAVVRQHLSSDVIIHFYPLTAGQSIIIAF